MNIVVLGGDISPERDISLLSAASVAKALEKAGYKVIRIDPKDGINQLDDIPKGAIVFPMLHGEGGEDGIIQTELEKRNLPYLGTMSKESRLCFDKKLTQEKLIQAGIPMPRGSVVNINSYWTNDLIKKPHVLKVSRGGSSIGTYIVRDPSLIDQAQVKKVFSLDEQAILEELIEGVEITIPIFDKTALPVIEIRPPENQEFDYENKYNGQTQEICPPESINSEVQKKAQRLAEQVHKVLGARHFSRVDIMVQNNSELFVLELNTIPGMTDESLYPKSAAVAGMPMPELMKKFVGLVARDYNLNNE